MRASAKPGRGPLYISDHGIVNAVTRIAHDHRGADRCARAFSLERLGGEIVRGDHQPPVLEPAIV